MCAPLSQRVEAQTPMPTAARGGGGRGVGPVHLHRDAPGWEHRVCSGARVLPPTDGRIVVNDVMFDPDLMPVLGPLMAPPG